MKLITFDVETTGIDVAKDRIITCFMRATQDKQTVFERQWVIDPGIEISEEVSEVHGMTTEWIQEHGRKDVKEAILDIVSKLTRYAYEEYIIAGYNHNFDLTMLEAELKRVTGNIDEKLEFRYKAQYLDPLIIDRALDKYRKGSRKLMDVARHYGIEVDDSKLHEASYDVLITEQLIPKILNLAWNKTKPDRPEMTPEEFITWLQVKQADWCKEWAEGITRYFAKQGKKNENGTPISVEGKFPW